MVRRFWTGHYDTESRESISPGQLDLAGKRVKILIVAPAWVGDCVMAHSLVRVLSARYPDVHIDMLAPAATQPLASRMPGVNGARLLAVDHGELGWATRRAMAQTLAREAYDQAIVLPNSFKSALIPWWAKIPRRTGWRGESRVLLLNDRRKLEPSHYPLMIERFMALGLDAGVMLDTPYPMPQLRASQADAGKLREIHGLASSGITVLCPGAEYGPAKRWPVRHFATVARFEVAKGQQVWLIGSPGDASICAEIKRLGGEGVVDLSGKTRLLDAIDLISQADRVVCNDSGLMHVACALGRKVIAVFGSTSAEFTPPLGSDAKVIRLGLSCSPCFSRQCPLGHLQCLNELAPASVIEAL